MTETLSSDGLFNELINDMQRLVEARATYLSQADLLNATQWMHSVGRTFAEATRYCDLMQFTDEQARQFMGGLLRAMIDTTRLAILDAKQRDATECVH